MMKTKKPLTAANALYRAAALCSKCEQAEADIRAKLKGWGQSMDDEDKIIQRLFDENYLNEERYARAFVKDKFRFGGWGRIKIAYNLRQKRLPEAVIDDALTEIDEEEYVAELERILRNKYKTMGAKEPLQAKASLVRFAASRGFEQNLIFPIVGKIVGGSDDEFME